jgi:ABC-type transport system substrate-binding protein
VNSSAIVAREVIERYVDDIMAHPVGSGPYRLATWKRSSRIVLEANPNFREEYYDAEPPADDPVKQAIALKMQGKRIPLIGRIEIYPVEEEQPRWLAFLNQEHDFIDRVPNDFANHAFPGNKLAGYLSKSGVQMDRQPGLEVTYAYFGMENQVVGGYAPEKIALRRAIVLGFNTDEEIRIILKNQAVPAQSPVGPGAFGFDDAFRTTANDYDPARARGLLDMYGFIDRDGDGYRENADGTKLELELATTPTQRDKQFDELWKKSMEAIGIRLRIKKARWPDLLKESRAGKLMMWQLGWGGPYPDAEAFFVMLYGPNSGQANHARFKNAEFDRLFEKARGTPPGLERAAIYREMNRLFLVNAPWKLGSHRMLTDLSQPWLIGHTRHPVHRASLRYLDIDLALQAKLKK